MKKAFLILATLSVFGSSVFAAGSSPAEQVRAACEGYVQDQYEAHYSASRGGNCESGNVTYDKVAVTNVWIREPGKTVSSIDVRGTITVSCSGALFAADQTFVRPYRVIYTAGGCMLGDATPFSSY